MEERKSTYISEKKKGKKEKRTSIFSKIGPRGGGHNSSRGGTI